MPPPRAETAFTPVSIAQLRWKTMLPSSCAPSVRPQAAKSPPQVHSAATYRVQCVADRGDACSYAHTSEELREVRRLILPLAREASNAEPNCSPYVEYVPPQAATCLDGGETALTSAEPASSNRNLFIPFLNSQVLGTGTRAREKGDSTPETPLLTDHPQLTAALEHSAYTQAVNTPLFGAATNEIPVLSASTAQWQPATIQGGSAETRTGRFVGLQSQFACVPPGLYQSTPQSCCSAPDWQQPSHTPLSSFPLSEYGPAADHQLF